MRLCIYPYIQCFETIAFGEVVAENYIVCDLIDGQRSENEFGNKRFGIHVLSI